MFAWRNRKEPVSRSLGGLARDEGGAIAVILAMALATPTDNFIPPSEPDIWLFGLLEAPGSGIPAAGALSAEGAGGIDGHYGHIIK